MFILLNGLSVIARMMSGGTSWFIITYAMAVLFNLRALLIPISKCII